MIHSVNFQVTPQFVQLLGSQFPGGVDAFINTLLDASEIASCYEQFYAIMSIVDQVLDINANVEGA